MFIQTQSPPVWGLGGKQENYIYTVVFMPNSGYSQCCVNDLLTQCLLPRTMSTTGKEKSPSCLRAVRNLVIIQIFIFWVL